MNRILNHIREVYQEKRHKKNYKRKKGNHKFRRRAIRQKQKQNGEKHEIKFINKPAPKTFSLIDNTNEVVKYINECREIIKQDNNVEWDIADVESITPDAITLLAACFNDQSFNADHAIMRGTHPKKKELNKYFIESGFYEHVLCDKNLKNHSNQNLNFLHKESDYKVQGEIARDACIYGVDHVFGGFYNVSDLYDMLIEAMANTNNHASGDKEGEVKWWLYTCNSEDGYTSYSFVDLGVGIFDSAPFTAIKKILVGVNVRHNADYVPNLLAGEIGTSKEYDKKIRGKGIPQIAKNSKNDYIKRAYIISNDVKINLKNNEATPLKEEFKGTFLYWELYNPQNQNAI